MKKVISIVCLGVMAAGCTQKSNDVWDNNNQTYKSKENRSLWTSEEEYSFAKNQEKLYGPSSEEFIPLRDEDLKSAFSDGAIPQPKVSPGEHGSGLPGIDKFQSPTSHLAAIFKNLYFNTDDHILRGRDSLASLDHIAAYLKEHPKTTVFVEGHCDERGPEAYNLSLGARRSNYIRTMLVKKGVNANQIHTISYGKEKPAIDGHNADAWSKNRRAQFKIFQKD